MLADETAELEGYAVARRELQIGDLVLDFIGLPHGVGEALRIECGQAPEGRPPLFADVLRGIVGPEELRFVILVVGYEAGPAGAPAARGRPASGAWRERAAGAAAAGGRSAAVRPGRGATRRWLSSHKPSMAL